MIYSVFQSGILGGFFNFDKCNLEIPASKTILKKYWRACEEVNTGSVKIPVLEVEVLLGHTVDHA